ncbi:MAG TPA: AMP-binding protein, partial [Ktedonobacteraceae bacterium]|nr:AMP-binding protein [Ktedonobacteraceae bacterium]
MIDSIVSTPAPVLLPDWLMRCAENFPDRLALYFGPFSWSFAELDRQVTRLAQQLASLGIAEGMRVALLAGSGLPYVVCVHALMRLGAVLVPLNVRLTLEELCWQLNDVRPALLISDEGYQGRLTEISQRLTDLPTLSLSVVHQDEDVLLCHLPLKEVPLRQEIDLSAIQAIMYTSGTTGQPKGALITFGMQWWNAVGSALNMGHNPEDRWLACMPLFHVGGLSILMKSVIYGIGVVLHERFDPAAVNAAIVNQRVTIISVVAVMLQRMLAELEKTGAETSYPETLRCVLLGGGPAPRVLLEACRDKQIPVVQTYGLTESCSQAVTLTSADALRKLGSAGRPLPPVQLRIV